MANVVMTSPMILFAVFRAHFFQVAIYRSPKCLPKKVLSPVSLNLGFGRSCSHQTVKFMEHGNTSDIRR